MQQFLVIENGDACDDDYPIKVSLAVDSIQWTKENKGCIEGF